MKKTLIIILKYLLVFGVTYGVFLIIQNRNFIKKYGTSKRGLSETLGNEIGSEWIRVMKEYLYATPPTNIEERTKGIKNIDHTAAEWAYAINDSAKNPLNLMTLERFKIGLENGSIKPWSNVEYTSEAANNLGYALKTSHISQLQKGDWQRFIKTVADRYGLDYQKDIQVINNAIQRYANTL